MYPKFANMQIFRNKMKYISLNHARKDVLQAIAKESVAQNIASAKFIKKYNLNSASSIQAAVKLLLKNDLLTQTGNGYRVYNFFLSEWITTILICLYKISTDFQKK